MTLLIFWHTNPPIAKSHLRLTAHKKIESFDSEHLRGIIQAGDGHKYSLPTNDRLSTSDDKEANKLHFHDILHSERLFIEDLSP